jgi:hypothetical protein
MLKRFFLSRTTSISLIVLMLVAVLLGFFFPQRFLSSTAELEAWQLASPNLSSLWRVLALDHVYTSPWFAVLLLLFLVSLLFSTWQQFLLALRKLRESVGGGTTFETTLSPEQAAAVLRSAGYRRVAVTVGGLRFVRHPWGYWGNFLLHLGIVVSIASSLMILLYEKRAVINLLEGEILAPGSQWSKEERGLLAGSLKLSEPVRLDRVKPEFYPNDNLRQLVTDFTFLDAGGIETPLSIQVNRSSHYRGVRIFQGKSFGTAFYVEFSRGQEEHREIFMLDHPNDRNTASYKNFRLNWLSSEFKVKSYADAERRSIESQTPLLVMRLANGPKVIDELSLKPGESGRLGDYTARLAAVERWGGLIFIDTTGMGGIFFGFFILCLGGALSYFFPPREFTVMPVNGGCRVFWRATRFARLYREEFESIRERLTGGRPDQQPDVALNEQGTEGETARWNSHLER